MMMEDSDNYHPRHGVAPDWEVEIEASRMPLPDSNRHHIGTLGDTLHPSTGSSLAYK